MAVASPELGHAAAAAAGGKEAGPVEVAVMEVHVNPQKKAATVDGVLAITSEEEEEVEAMEEEAEEEHEEEEDEYGGDEDDEEGVKWLKHYSSRQSILVIGDGDFSFSLALALAFCSGDNLVSTSLDSYEALRSKYRQAESNIMVLKIMGATTLHGVDAKTMKHHTDLKMRRFDRIVFNFPHAGFKGKEDDVRLIKLHKDLVRGFLQNARHLLRPYGEIHVSHKIGRVYDQWKIERLASESSVIMVEKVGFQIEDYPGYNHKRGDGKRCDEPFALGPCCTLKFSIRDLKKKKKGHSNRSGSIPSLRGSKVYPELLAADRRPSHPPVNAVNMPLSLDPYSLGIAQSYQPGGLPGASSCFLRQDNIQPMLSFQRLLPNLFTAVGGIAPPTGRITSICFLELQEQPRPILRPWESAGFCNFAREYQMSLQRDFEKKSQMMPAGISLDYFVILKDHLRDPVEEEKWILSMIALYATR